MISVEAYRMALADSIGLGALQVQNELAAVSQHNDDPGPLTQVKLGRLIASLDRLGSLLGMASASIRADVGPVMVDPAEVYELVRELDKMAPADPPGITDQGPLAETEPALSERMEESVHHHGQGEPGGGDLS